jgi:anti-sigma B factor antagonist
MGMELEIQEYVLRIVVVAVKERLDAYSAPPLRDQLHSLLDERSRHLVIDLSQTPFMDSAGMAVLVTVLKRARQQGGDVKLVWPQEDAARRIIELTKFDRVFEMTHTVQEAIGRFKVN